MLTKKIHYQLPNRPAIKIKTIRKISPFTKIIKPDTWIIGKTKKKVSTSKRKDYIKTLKPQAGKNCYSD